MMLPNLIGQPYTASLIAATPYLCALRGEGHCPSLLRVWDHCHGHGLIRGPVCPRHNSQMRMFDASAPGYRDRGGLIAYALRCPGCSACGVVPWTLMAKIVRACQY